VDGLPFLRGLLGSNTFEDGVLILSGVGSAVAGEGDARVDRSGRRSRCGGSGTPSLVREAVAGLAGGERGHADGELVGGGLLAAFAGCGRRGRRLPVRCQVLVNAAVKGRGTCTCHRRGMYSVFTLSTTTSITGAYRNFQRRWPFHCSAGFGNGCW